jgi:hypothetical protein
MGFPDLQDGRPPRDRAGAELTSGPVPAEMPDEDTTGYRPPAPGTAVHPPPANGTAGSRPAGRSGAHRRSVASPQRQARPAAPTATGAPDRSGARRGPLRGFPPPPGQPGPVYPPGQFSPWNRASTRAAWLGMAGAEGGAAEADPGYSALAVSDAAADLTSTQTWTSIDDEPPPGPSFPARAGTPTGPQGLAGPATGLQEPATPGDPGGAARVAPGRMAARQAAADGASTARPAPSAFGEAERGRPSRTVAAGGLAAEGGEEPDGRRAGKRGGRSTTMMAAMLLAPVLAVLVVVAGYVYFSGKRSPAPAHPAAASHPTAAPSSSPSPTLGPWKHIESRSQDPVPLTVGQLFPASFARDGAAGTLAVSKSGSRCSHEVFGSKLAAAIRKAKCTQVLRASYLSTDRKIMATVGVLNLNDVTGAEKAGKAAGATQFIKQLPSRHGPTRNLAKGTGIEVAEVKGHYLILIWTEFANLRAPKGKTQRQKLESFSVGLVAGTANVSLSNRMVTGRP